MKLLIFLLLFFFIYFLVTADIDTKIKKIISGDKTPENLYFLLWLKAKCFRNLKNSFSIVEFACEKDDTQLLRYLFKLGFSPNQRSHWKCPSLFEWAMDHYSFDIIKIFIENGVDVNDVCSDASIKCTPLYILSNSTRPDKDIIIKYLKEHGAK